MNKFAITIIAVLLTTLSVAEAGNKILANDKGMTLYTFAADENGNSTCYDACAQSWKPYLASTNDDKSRGYSVVSREDGGQQWSYKKQPLYTWIADAKPGDTNGDGVGGVWHVATKYKKKISSYSSGNYDSNDKNY
ncbi:MAG: putative lipoprotein with Yx(FWY)xxD motif [Parasphingorhabdus sp.]|jgi:predicted lipoprotein with Yx(FWY)xxD motif